jgi:short-subunit dehydrogenase
MVAIITGASSGIGLETARALARRGFRTVLVARRADRLAALAAECGAHAASQAVALDLLEPTAIEPAIAPLLERDGGPDLLVNAAGRGLYRPFLAHSAADHHQLMQLNYFAPLALIRLVLPSMLAQGRGQVVNVASMTAKMSSWGHAGYGASKGALVALTQTLAAEYAGTGLRFSYVVPGIVRTAYFEEPSLALLWRRVSRHAVSADAVARGIVSLLDRPRLELCIPRHYRMVDWLRALSPAAAHALVARSSAPPGRTR